jgi:dihydrofolate synthase/folylpolyglutamate synthase
LQHFKRSDCQVVVLETGMGGRLDATNAVTPLVSVITPIDYDHQKWLGNSLGAIAREKAGIIKQGVPVVSARQEPEAADIIRTTARELAAPLRIMDESYSGPVALPGLHQKQNAAVAIAALESANIEVGEWAIRSGLTSVAWPARFQRWDARITIDGAHNPAGARVLARTWRETFGSNCAAIVFAVLRDKNVAEIIAALAPIASRFVVTQARSERAIASDELAEIVHALAPDASLERAASFGEAMRITAADAHVLITGSLHFAGEALAHLEGALDEFDECSQ